MEQNVSNPITNTMEQNVSNPITNTMEQNVSNPVTNTMEQNVSLEARSHSPLNEFSIIDGSKCSLLCSQNPATDPLT
jgi:hypothetical protein